MRLSLLCMLVFAFAPAAQGIAREDAQSWAVAQIVQELASPDEPGLSVAVLHDGAVVARSFAGQADLEHAAAIDARTVFHAASLSKQVTAFAVLLLEQDGRLSIDDPISTYLPETAGLPSITLRRLMDHTNGLRDLGTLLAAAGWRSEDLVTDQHALDMVLSQQGLNFAPGSAFQYNNSGYVLLAEVVRRVSGQRLPEFCQARIFGPLGMAHTRFQDDVSRVQAGRAQSYAAKRGGFSRLVLSYAYVGPTGLQTTTDDLLRWAANFEHGTVGGDAAHRRMTLQGRLDDGGTSTFALGQERHIHRGHTVWRHGGRDAGFRSFLLRVPGERLAVAVLSNRDDIDAADVAFRVADLYLPPTETQGAPATHATPDALRAYAGDYALFPGVLLHVSTDGQRLLLATGQSPTALFALSRNAFALDPAARRSLVFDAPVAGASPRLQYVLGSNGSLSARRVHLVPFSPAALDLDAYVGRYRSAELRAEYTVARDGDGLVARHPRRLPVRLRAYQPETFSGDDGVLTQLRFVRDAQGRVSGFELAGPVAEGIAFARLPGD